MKALGQEKNTRETTIFKKKARSQNNMIFISSWYAKVVFFGFEGGGPVLNVKKFPNP